MKVMMGEEVFYVHECVEIKKITKLVNITYFAM